MKAAVCRAFNSPLSIEEVSLAAPNQGEIKVKLAACAICHSDILYSEGAWGGALPTIYGHEAAGRVVATGADVHSVKTGDHVVITLIRACGHCHYCAQGVPVCCETTFPLDRISPLRSADGLTIGQGLRTAAFAEFLVVDASQAVVIDPDIPLDCACLLACGVLTGFGAVVNTARLPAGATALVIGAGGVGLNSIQAAVLSKAKTVIAVDITANKRAAALRFGASHALDAAAEDIIAQVFALTDGRGADYVFVTVGARAAFEQSFSLLSRNGTLVLVGMPPDGVNIAIDPGAIAGDNQRILGSKMGSANIQRDIPYLVSLYRQGRLKLDELISGHYPLENINQAIASVKRGEALRNVIVFPS